MTPLATVNPPTTTTVLSVPTPDVEGYVINVLDGHTFDLQSGPAHAVTRLTLGSILVPDIGTCEGTVARSGLARLIAGKPVRIDPAGTVWFNDIDVAKSMVVDGYAKAATTTYVSEDTASVDFNCASTTTTTIPLVVVAPQHTTKPTTPKPKRKAAAATAALEPEPEPTPPAATPPATTPPPQTRPPATTRAPVTTLPPAATQASAVTQAPAPPPAATDPPATAPKETKPEDPAPKDTKPKETKPPKATATGTAVATAGVITPDPPAAG